jgi:fumarate hydratase subunit alpha/L(+)-tartrate dehydratase alpha subunit
MLTFEKMVDVIADLYDLANRSIPKHTKNALMDALAKETNPRAKKILSMMLKTAEICEVNREIVCQDTGVPEFVVKIGSKFELKFNLEKAIYEGIRKVTRRSYYRGIVAHPLTYERSMDNTGFRVPIIYYEIDYDSECLEITAIPKGTGSSRWAALQIFDPYNVITEIKKFILDSFLRASSKPCPPIILGIGIGGTPTLAMLLAKKAILRPVNVRNPDHEIAKLENELLDIINKTGIGPMGLGGDTTALAVNIEVAHTFAAMTPVGVEFQCWPNRRATCRICKNGQVEFLRD